MSYTSVLRVVADYRKINTQDFEHEHLDEHDSPAVLAIVIKVFQTSRLQRLSAVLAA
jgi:hypothetical protein